MKIEMYELIEKLESGGFLIFSQRRLPDDFGIQFRLTTGQVVNRFDTGTVNVQGANPDPVRKLLGLCRGSNSRFVDCLSPG